MDVSIIIVNFNSARYTGECIDSVVQHTVGLAFEIIVVDNNSESNDVDLLEEILETKDVRLIKSKIKELYKINIT